MSKIAPKQQQFETLFQMMAAFPDEQSAIDHFTAIRWRNGAYCPLCGSTKVYHFSDKRTHKCGDCRKRFSIKVGSIFEDSKIGLRQWMMAIWLITSHKKGIASTTLAKDLGVTQKTAWFMLHRLRYAARTQSFNRPLEGEVEVDETYVGGKAANRHKGDPKNGPGTSGKTAVIGAIQRGGKAVATVTAHYEVGLKVRETMKELSGRMPEDLPVAEDVKKIAALERKQQRLRHATPQERAAQLPPQPKMSEPVEIDLRADLWKYALLIMSVRPNGEISTTDMINEMPGYVHLSEEHAEANASRKDSKFSQLVRNLKSHKTTKTNFIYQGYAQDVPGGFKITHKGLDFVREYFRN